MDNLTPNPEFRRHLEESVALRRFGTKQEVAAMAVFLASDAASYVTGSLMYCDGGMTLSMGGAMSPTVFQQFMKSP
jgi:NAD(P)-dependent dehydrogenase (short-subunit alcohol dehydrogenase family)